MEKLIGYVVIMRNVFGCKAFTDIQKERKIPEHIRNAEIFPLIDDSRPTNGEKVRNKVRELIRWEVKSLAPEFPEVYQITARLNLNVEIKENLHPGLLYSMVAKAEADQKPLLAPVPDVQELLDQHTRQRMIDEIITQLEHVLGL